MALFYNGPPTTNRICTNEWQRRNQRQHRERLVGIKCRIDNAAPPVYPHLLNKCKKEQVMEERYAEIERDNRILLKKMSHIMRSNTLDNVNAIRPRSLNAVSRKRELKRIMAENQAILRRIQDRRPFYNRKDWEHHQNTHSAYLSNIKERPVPRLKSAHARSTMTRRGVPRRRTRTAVLEPLQDNNHVLSPGKRGKRKKAHAELAKEGVSIGGQYVVVTVDEVKSPDHALIFKTYDIDSTERASVRIPFADIAKLPEYERRGSTDAREELATALLPRLSFKEGALVFNGEEQFEPAPEEVPATEAARNEAKRFLDELDKQDEEAKEKDPNAEGSEVSEENYDDEPSYDDEDSYGEEAKEEEQPDTATQEEAAAEPLAEEEVEMVEEVSHKWSELELALSCTDLPEKDSVVAMYRSTGADSWELCSKTERKEKEPNPSFSEALLLAWTPSDTALMFKVYDADDDKELADTDLMGCARCTARDVFSRAGQPAPLKLPLEDAEGEPLGQASLSVRVDFGHTRTLSPRASVISLAKEAPVDKQSTDEDDYGDEYEDDHDKEDSYGEESTASRPEEEAPAAAAAAAPEAAKPEAEKPEEEDADDGDDGDDYGDDFEDHDDYGDDFE